MKHFKSSPLWLIGLFVLFAEGTSAIAAVQLSGWPQEALVVFVISYASVVTLVFFAFLWFKPENFYSPSEYAEITPEAFIKAIRGMPSEVTEAVGKLSEDPQSTTSLYMLMDSLFKEETKQHLVLMKRGGGVLEISNRDQYGHSHHYEILGRDGGVSFGLFSPATFVKALRGTDLIIVAGDGNSIRLTPRGEAFAQWVIENKRDAESFKSEKGGWGKDFDVKEVLTRRSTTPQ